MSAAKNQAKMASDDQDRSDKKEVMQSNLPLLFANASPISLESMNLFELQGFLLFLLKCECGKTIHSLSDIEPPGWWPAEVAFVDDLLGRNTKKGMWSSVMRKLIQRCYDHHSSTFLLEFSRKLMIATQDSNKIKVIDNGDGTRSMRSAISDKLLVTFRSENQDYDKKQRQQMNSFSTQSPLKKRCSLSLGINASDPRLPKCEDLYLCDNCGASFQALQEVLVHEKNCFDTSMEPVEDPHKRYFSYLGLEPKTVANTKDSFRKIPSKVVRPKPSTYAKFLSIDIASPLGQYIYSLSKNTKDKIDISSLCMAERKSALRSMMPSNSSVISITSSQSNYMPPLYEGGHGDEFPVTFRSHRYRKKGKEDPHLYCFNKYQKAVRRYTLEHGMTPRSMKIYKEVQKRRCKVGLKRLNLDRVKDIMEKMILDEERRKLDRVKREKLKQLKERARHFEPFVPKITSAYHIKKQSSVSVLQSFTSAVQQLCSPEKESGDGGSSSSSSNGTTNNYKKHYNKKPVKKSMSSSIKNNIQPAIHHPSKKKQTPEEHNKQPQCIDLISSSDDENF